MRNLFSLEGRTALVTGGSRGIGKMIAAGFIAQGREGVHLVAQGRGLRAAATELSSGGGVCIPLPADVSTVAGAKALAEAYRAREKKLDILVNNAGAAWLEKFDNFPKRAGTR